MLRGAPVVYDKGERIQRAADRRGARAEPDRSRRTTRATGWRVVPEIADRAVRGLFGVPAEPLPQAARDTVVLRILATGDLHGALLTRRRAAGGRSTAWAEACGCPHAPRSTRATPCRARRSRTRAAAGPAWSCSAASGYAAAALGDHDFDWSIEMLRQRLDRVGLSVAGRERAWTA